MLMLAIHMTRMVLLMMMLNRSSRRERNVAVLVVALPFTSHVALSRGKIKSSPAVFPRRNVGPFRTDKVSTVFVMFRYVEVGWWQHGVDGKVIATTIDVNPTVRRIRMSR